MVQVTLSGILPKAAGNISTFEVDAKNIHQLLSNLGKQYPELKPHLGKGSAVSIDGTIYRDNWFQPISPGSEVYIIPRLAGG